MTRAASPGIAGGSRRRVALVWLTAILMTSTAQATFIEWNFLGGSAPIGKVFGGGNLIDIFNAAADVWEMHSV